MMGYVYHYDAGQDTRGRAIRFCWTTDRDEAGVFHGWRELLDASGTVLKKDKRTSSKVAGQMARMAKKRRVAELARQERRMVLRIAMGLVHYAVFVSRQAVRDLGSDEMNRSLPRWLKNFCGVSREDWTEEGSSARYRVLLLRNEKEAEHVAFCLKLAGCLEWDSYSRRTGRFPARGKSKTGAGK